MKNQNEDLNKDFYKDAKCHRCKRQYPDTILNIEAYIHHGAKFLECVDRKTCNRIFKKLKGKTHVLI